MKLLINITLAMVVTAVIACSYSSNSNNSTNKNDSDKVTKAKITDTTPANGIFTEDVIVKDSNGKEMNLKQIEITKDTVMVFAWCKTCGACIHCLDFYKSKDRYKSYQIIAIAMTKNDTIDREKYIVRKHHWNYQVYFDKNQSLVNYLTKKGYYKQPASHESYVGFYGFPQIFMFVKEKFFCKSCDKYANPSSVK